MFTLFLNRACYKGKQEIKIRYFFKFGTYITYGLENEKMHIQLSVVTETFQLNLKQSLFHTDTVEYDDMRCLRFTRFLCTETQCHSQYFPLLKSVSYSLKIGR